MWIKTRNGRLIELTGTVEMSIEKADPKWFQVEVTPYGGKPIVVAAKCDAERAQEIMTTITNGLIDRKILIEL